ncbi:hypothetical protein FBUS_04949 [Fasciolopsis buskii]|uniref:SWIM-type domain-containing protein n=1 Tax=Fasciolopsis buskii TaxID=27845 RepID=A0A8E0VIE3_9TREM|nr:hypothetical protein FBUS_04949 [Fasciolopsis buski]
MRTCTESSPVTSSLNISDELLLTLHTAFGELCYFALDCLERGSVTLEYCPSGREIYKVQSSSGAVQYCSYDAHYCPCLTTWMYSPGVQNNIWCKHLLSVFLAILIGRYKKTQVANNRLGTLIELLYTPDFIPLVPSNS